MRGGSSTNSTNYKLQKRKKEKNPTNIKALHEIYKKIALLTQQQYYEQVHTPRNIKKINIIATL